MGQLSRRGPIPALTLTGKRVTPSFLGTAAGPPQLGLLKPSLLCVPKGHIVGVPALPLPPHPSVAISADICGSSTPSKHHLLTLGATAPCLPGRDMAPSPTPAQLPRWPCRSPSSPQASGSHRSCPLICCLSQAFIHSTQLRLGSLGWPQETETDKKLSFQL